MRKKAQTAMEYLMTYGWAILIIIVVIAALYSLGVFSVKSGIACSPCFGSQFTYIDYDDSAGILYLRTGARTIDTLAATCTPLCTGTIDCPAGTPCDPGTDITITGIDTTSGASIDISLSYRDTASLVTHSETGKITNP